MPPPRDEKIQEFSNGTREGEKHKGNFTILHISEDSTFFLQNSTLQYRYLGGDYMDIVQIKIKLLNKLLYSQPPRSLLNKL
jgi:hypothetical protein